MRLLSRSVVLVLIVACDGAEKGAKAPGAAPSAPIEAHEPANALREPAEGPAEGREPIQTLAEARKGFKTNIVREDPPFPLDRPPARGPFTLVRYDAPPGKLVAYLTKDPGDGKKHPAIVWITGGDNNSIGDVWHEGPREDEQTASAYRKAGIVMLFPSQRGGNHNPGKREGFLGEVEDVLAAADFLAEQPFVDPDRIYLGGHSTGGTLALLVAETSNRFRAVLSFGPVADVRMYGGDFIYCDDESDGLKLRSPVSWLSSIRSPVFVIEGAGDPGNSDALRFMKGQTDNPHVRFYEVAGTDHFGILAPVNELIAEKIAAGGPVELEESELQELFR